jgi:hypothetical protein
VTTDGAGCGDAFAGSGGGTIFGAAVCALGGAGAGVTVRCATVRAGTTAPGFEGADGASRKITSERPTNPRATAATPYSASVFTEDRVLPAGGRG